MRHRLKIAWTVFFVVLTVALCVLWVRSYWRPGGIDFLFNDEWVVASNNGKLIIADLWNNSGAAVQFWYLVLVSIAGAVAPQLKWQSNFSLRTMLIVTSLVAVVLGLTVYFARK